MRKVLYIFGLLSDADVAWMAQTGIRRRLGDGDVVIREGASSDSLIFMLEGELLVTTRRLGQIARLGVGEWAAPARCFSAALRRVGWAPTGWVRAAER